MKKHLLIAVDGSIYSSQSLEYVAFLFAEDADINFHLLTCISSNQSVIAPAVDSNNSLLPEASGMEKKRLTAELLLEKATDKLVSLQIPPQRINSSVAIADHDIGNTIQRQAEQLLMDSILIGRRGLNAISKMLLGSVSATMLNNCHQIPLWVLDGEGTNKNFLAPVDGSLPSLMAIDHLAHIMAGRKDITIFLFHCRRILGKTIAAHPESFYHLWDKEWCDTYLTADDHLFRGPTQLLIEAGIPENNIIILPEVSDIGAASGILRQADKNQCGTIVIGRRGDGTANSILGGVSERTIKKGQNITLWVVG